MELKDEFFKIWYVGFRFLKNKMFLVFPNEIIVYFCTRYEFFRVLHKDSFQLKYTQLCIEIKERIMKNFVKLLQDCFMVFAANGPATSTGTTAATAVPVRTGSWPVST